MKDTEITLYEIRKQKRSLEKAIAASIQDFTRSTGLAVKEISVNTDIFNTGGAELEIINSQIKIQVDL